MYFCTSREKSLQGLNDLLYLTPRIDWSYFEKDITRINRKLIDLFKSPRSSITRVACQTAGELFRCAQCVKSPEFDEIVDILLSKTADSNRFIQKNANLALDKLVTFIPPFYSVRAICARGPVHRNTLVRLASARLLVCVCAIAGVDNIMGSTANTMTRKRILAGLSKFVRDKCQETR